MQWLKAYAAWYEIPLAFGLLVALNQLVWPEWPGFLEIDPHPYWLPILLFGFRYGITAGVVSGSLAAALYLGSAWHSVDPYRLEDFSFYFLPGTFVLLGALIGVVTARDRARIAQLQAENAQAAAGLQHVQEEARTLADVNRGLEQRIVSRMSTLVTLYEGARRLDATSLEALYPALLDFIAKTLEADVAALYLRDGATWRLHTSHGWRSEEQRPRSYAWNEGLVGRAGAFGRVVSVRDVLSDEVLVGGALSSSDAVMAGPLFAGEGGDPVAIVAIQQLPLTQFHSAGINLFSFLLGWGSRAIGRAQYVEALKAGEILDPEFQLYSARYFAARAEQEFLRSRTYYLPLGIVLVQVEGLDGLRVAQRDRLLLALAQLLKGCVRDLDIVARYGAAEIPFAMLLITATEQHVAQACAQFRERLTSFRLHAVGEGFDRIRIRVGAANFTPAMHELATLLQAAQQRLLHSDDYAAAG
ncbi:MAG: diguanylate cyclase [Deltaproteobacteria bacterium]|nr:diguanylate cyclase [Deltaproteobacteria bacterium]